MPGPGGGSRGGGGSFGGGGGHRGGGGFGGGGRRGGGFGGGGFHRGPRGPRRPHWGWGRRWGWGWGPGFWGGGFFSIALLPFLLVLVAAVLIFGTISSAFGAISDGPELVYNEEWFQDFANEQYAQVFSAEGYEDNILLVYLTTEDNSQGYFIAWVGDHIDSRINEMFGNEQTALGRATAASINTTNYKYQLDSGIAMVLDKMASHVVSYGPAKTFTCYESQGEARTRFENYTSLPLTPSTVEDAADRFTAATGIQIAVVVEEAEDIFETDYSGVIFGVIIALVLIGVAVFFIVKGLKSRKNNNNNNNGGGGGGYDDEEIGGDFRNNGGGNFYSSSGY